MVGHHVGPEHCLEAWEDNVGVFHEGGHMVTQAMFRDLMQLCLDGMRMSQSMERGRDNAFLFMRTVMHFSYSKDER